ncbi:MAG TPA: glycosyltransferase family 9 protein [Candidatus Acidoferrum sp.]|nr:glycosyltransferase family 9 protein [Candidatus Acidoferrum sp.]
MRRLVIRPGAIGDVIVSLPALEHLRSDYLEVWTTARSVPLIRFADRARAISATGLDLLGIADTPAKLLEELTSFDSIVSWYGANRPEFREAVAGLPFEFLPALPAAGCPLHATDFYLQQVGAPAGGIPRIAIEVEREQYAVVHPFSGSPRKNWPLDRFQRLAAKLPIPVRWCAGEEDPPLPGAVRIPDLFDLAKFLAGAALYIGNDSGITHLAAAVGTPTLAIFVASDPAVWAPRGDHVRVVRSLSAAQLP